MPRQSLRCCASIRRCNRWSRPPGARTECSLLCRRPLTEATALSLCPHPSLAVSRATMNSETRGSRRSPLSSRRRRSPPSSAPHHPGLFAFVSTPIDTPTLSPSPIPPVARSLGSNHIGVKGASALAAILKETMISNLKCAAAQWCSLLCQRPLTLCSPLLWQCRWSSSSAGAVWNHPG